MIDFKEAAMAAEAHARDLYPDDELRFLRVEEIELSEDANTWNVTLGWVERATRESGPMVGTLSGATELITLLPRVYKRFAIDAETGAVRSMKIRKVG